MGGKPRGNRLTTFSVLKCPDCNYRIRRLTWAVYAGTWDHVTYAQGYGRGLHRTCIGCKTAWMVSGTADAAATITKLIWTYRLVEKDRIVQMFE